MKKYVFICLTSEGYGGAQLYINYKERFLESLGFSTYIVSCCAEKGKPNINHDISSIIIKKIAINPKLLTRISQKRIINKIRRFISYSLEDEIIIESLSFPFALWGELIASNLNCKSIIYSISESNKINSSILPFVEFKTQRGEVACIDPRFIYGLYEKSLVVNPGMVLKLEAYIGDVTLDYSPEVLNKIVYREKNILVFGRLEKQYVIEAAREISLFCSRIADHSFSVLFIGDSPNRQSKKRIEAYFERLPNVSLIMLGGINPVPRSLFKRFDVIIAGSGCASTSFRNGGVTIAMDVKDNGLPLGLMGYDTVSTFKRDNPGYVRLTLQELLMKLLFENYAEGKIVMDPIPLAPSESFVSHMDFVSNSCSSKQFFEINKMKVDRIDYLRAFLVLVLGNRNKADSFQIALKRLFNREKNK